MPRDAADLTMLKPSTGRIVERQTLFRLKLVERAPYVQRP
jgi:hypothetical protein